MPDDMRENAVDIDVAVETKPETPQLPLSCFDVHKEAAARPDWRFVKGIPGNSDACCPLCFEYAGGQFAFPADLASTSNHRHALCEEMLDAAGPEPSDDERCSAPVFLDINSLPEDAQPFVKMRFDASAKWIKLYTEG